MFAFNFFIFRIIYLITKAKKIDVFYSFFISDNNEILFGFILIYINYIIINFIIILNEIKNNNK